MKKIHEGCLAIYVGNPNDERSPDGRANTGKLLRVGKPLRFISELNDFFWEVDKEILYKSNFETPICLKIAAESRLQPLDESDISIEEITEEHLESTT